MRVRARRRELFRVEAKVLGFLRDAQESQLLHSLEEEAEHDATPQGDGDATNLGAPRCKAQRVQAYSQSMSFDGSTPWQ